MPVLARKPGALRNGAPFKDWILPASPERVRRKLAKAPRGDRQATPRTPKRSATACTRPTSSSTSSPDNASPGRPLTIATPVALGLGCEPMADCARYDSLRGTG